MSLPRQFLRSATSLEIEFTVHWAWLLPVWRAPAIRVGCIGDGGQTLAEGVFPAGTMRTTHVRLAVPKDAASGNERLTVRITRQLQGEELEQLVFGATTPTDAARAIEVLKRQVLAMDGAERIVCDRLHDGVSQFGFRLTLRLADRDQRSLLNQIAAEIHAALHCDGPEEGAVELGRTAIRFAGPEVDWSETVGSPRARLPRIPGHYHLWFRVGEVVVATTDFSIGTFRSAVATAQATVRKTSAVAGVALSADNHRGVTVPLQGVAEDFAAINATVTLDVAQPDPLVSETRHRLDLVMLHEGRELRREHRRVALRSGRRRSVLSLALSPNLFIAGPGIYRVGVWLDDRLLHTGVFEHKTRAQLKQEQAEAILRSLRLAEPRLFCVRDGARVESSDVFATDAAVVPTFCISGEGFDEEAPALQWQIGIQWQQLDSGEKFEEYRTLVAKPGPNPCHDLELPLQRPDKDFPPGRYAVQLRKRDQVLQEFRFRILSVEEIGPYTEQAIRRSLRTEASRLLIRAGNTFYPCAQVPDSADGILPELTLHTSGYNRFVSSLSAQLRFVVDRGGERSEIATLPVTLSAKPLRLQHILIKVRDGSLGAINGPATLMLFIDQGEVARFPFRVVSREDILGQVKVAALRIEAESVRGGGTCAVSSLDLREHRAFSVCLEIHAGFPAPGVEFAACALLRTESHPIGQAPFALSLEQTRTFIHGHPVPLSRLPLRESSTPQRLTIEVFIGGELKGSTTWAVITGQRISDFEGQLTVDPHHLPVDDAEYEAILRRL